MLRNLHAFLVVFLTAGSASAATWAESMFDDLSRDFGSVPRGPTLSHSFRLTNKSDQYVHIAGVRVSCGCVTASAVKTDLAPKESTAIYAEMDTRRFTGLKTVHIYVQFDRPRWEEVRLWVQANGRDDVTLSPDSLAYGQIKRGSMPSVSVTVNFLGNSQWKIVEALCDSNYVQPKIEEVRRDYAEVSYKLTARIRSDTPVGKWYTDVWLKTNNASTPRIRVPVTVEIESALAVSPSVANLGQVKEGGEAERKVIVRAVKPFKITRVAGEDALLSVKDSTTEAKPVHVLTVKFKAGEPGEINRTFKIMTDLKEDSEVEFQAIAQVVP
jgi:hypothetical protein